MFSLIKEQVDFEKTLTQETQLEFRRVGESNFEFEDKTCPFCSHRDCFRVKLDGPNSFFHCFSCEAHGDVIEFISKYRKISPRDAALALAKENGIDIPANYSPIQEIFELAAKYYHQNYLDDDKVYAELSGLTPKKYQETVRKHKPETLTQFQIGWSDGGLVKFLEALGFEGEILQQTGLVNKKGQDFLPAKVFIYPHRVRGRVSHFTFKDPLKVKEYQLKNSSKLNGHVVYNQDDSSQQTVAIVEGENDLLSMVDHGWAGGVIATIGQISSSQISWLETTLRGKNVLTFFDTDSAGDKYRDKLAASRFHFGTLTQIKLTNGFKDIDEYLTQGGALDETLKVSAVVVKPSLAEKLIGETDAPSSETEEPVTQEQANSTIVEREGCYYKIRMNKDGDVRFDKLTNFVIELRNVFVRGDEREREIVIVRNDGIRSSPVMVDSECKVSLKSFKVMLANAVDASFYGSEADLTEFWEAVYQQNQKRERIVYIPGSVGKLAQFGGGWLFRNMFITDTGAVIRPDSEGIIWLDNNTTGLKAAPIDIGENGKFGIPALNDTLSKTERKELLNIFLHQLAKNLNSPYLAITLTAWGKANVYSDELFEAIQGFPFLFIWGRHGQGKTVIGKWIASLFDMDDSGYMTISQLKSGVGWGRKQAYYSSLPLLMDEIRADKMATNELYPNVRSWYQRASRPLGTKEGMNIRVLPVRSTTIFLGQDEFTDSATKQRTVTTRVPLKNRELVESYKAIMSRKEDLSAIGYDWILESTERDRRELISAWRDLDKKLVEAGCEARSAKNWAAVGVFGVELAKEYFPDLNYEAYLLETARADSQAQIQDDTIYRFFTDLEGLYLQERAGFTGDHIKREGNKLYIWFREVFRIVQSNQKINTPSDERFTENAVRAAIRDEQWWLGEDREPMGVTETRRRVLIIDLTKAPEVIQNIANAL